jgi:hypothetical protein
MPQWTQASSVLLRMDYAQINMQSLLLWRFITSRPLRCFSVYQNAQDHSSGTVEELWLRSDCHGAAQAA